MNPAPARPTTEIVVCSTCRAADAPRDEPAAGQALLDAVQAACAAAGEPGLRVRGQACLAACSRACTVALQAPGKWSYVFGGLTPDADVAAQVLACARLHRDTADGLLGWKERPEPMRRGTVARLMPLDAGAAAVAPGA